MSKKYMIPRPKNVIKETLKQMRIVDENGEIVKDKTQAIRGFMDGKYDISFPGIKRE